MSEGDGEPRHYTVSKTLLNVRLFVAIFSTKLRIYKSRRGELRSPYNVNLAKVASCNPEKTSEKLYDHKIGARLCS